jgi:hypothetical protein
MLRTSAVLCVTALEALSDDVGLARRRTALSALLDCARYELRVSGGMITQMQAQLERLIEMSHLPAGSRLRC